MTTPQLTIDRSSQDLQFGLATLKYNESRHGYAQPGQSWVLNRSEAEQFVMRMHRVMVGNGS